MDLNKTILQIVTQKNFKSIVVCIEYLYHAGYPLQQAYNIACSAFNPKININIPNIDRVLGIINGCYVNISMIDEEYPAIHYWKGKKLIFNQQLQSGNIWFDMMISEGEYDYLRELLEQHLGVSGYKFRQIIS